MDSESGARPSKRPPPPCQPGYCCLSARAALARDGRALWEGHLSVMRQAPGDLSAPDTERAGHDEPEARDPERNGPPTDYRRPMCQHPREVEKGDNREQSPGDQQIGPHD